MRRRRWREEQITVKWRRRHVQDVQSLVAGCIWIHQHCHIIKLDNLLNLTWGCVATAKWLEAQQEREFKANGTLWFFFIWQLCCISTISNSPRAHTHRVCVLKQTTCVTTCTARYPCGNPNPLCACVRAHGCANMVVSVFQQNALKSAISRVIRRSHAQCSVRGHFSPIRQQLFCMQHGRQNDSAQRVEKLHT